MHLPLSLLLACLLAPVIARASPDTATAPVATPASPPAATVQGDDPDVSSPGSPAEPKPDPSAEQFWHAVKLLESRVPADQAAGRKLLQEVSDHEYAHAQTLLGNCHLSGSYGFPKDARKAVNLFRLAAEQGNAFAKVSLGTCYATGTGIRKNDPKAAEWLVSALAANADFSRPPPPAEFPRDTGQPKVAGELAADPVDASRATAHFLLGQINTRLNQAAEAQAHYVAAATAGPDGRSGIYQAAVEAAVNYAFGKGVPRDSVKAGAMLDQSRRLNARMGVSLIHNYVSLKIVDEFAVADLEQEVAEAGAGNQSAVQLHIAQTLADKKSKDYNAAEAARWYEIAAENGQTWAMISLALMQARGEPGRPDPARAFYWFEKAGGGEKPKNLLGTGNLVICLLQGFGVAKDEARALSLARKHRNESFLCHLATIGQAPTAVISQEEESRLVETWAKKKNDAHAQYLLGLNWNIELLQKGKMEDAGRWMKKAAKAGHAEALCTLGWLYQFYPAQFGFHDAAKAAREATACYQAAGEAGSIEGLANYANSLASGFGVKRDEDGAIATYERCLKIDPNHSRSHSNLGGIYNNKLIAAAVMDVSFGTAEWKRLMLEHYEASARQETPYSLVPLGDLYYEGRFVRQDWGKAYDYYDRATAFPTHKADAHYRLGLMHEAGQGVPVTYTEAAYHYRIAALEGHVPALRRLIDFYLTGTGVSLDFDRAAYWLNFMARLGQADALVPMADVLLNKGDYEPAVKLLRVLARDGNATISGYADERLSRCYFTGKGVEKSEKRGMKYLKSAVGKGNGDALATLAHLQLSEGKTTEAVANLQRAAKTSDRAAYNLGQMYFFGTYVAPDRALGLKYLQQAAASNNSEAQFFLAALTWNREADAPGLDEAIALAQRAENLGHPKASRLREDLELRRKTADAKPEENSRTRSS